MNIHHKNLANGCWNELSFVEQMANLGSEIDRSLQWKKKNNIDYCKKAFDRALELLDLTIEDSKNVSRLKELIRVREVLVDFFLESNVYGSTDASWQKYFACFAYAARRNY